MWSRAALCLLVLLLAALPGKLAQKAMSVQLRARWPGTPIAWEALEAVVRASKLLSGNLEMSHWHAATLTLVSHSQAC